MAQKQAVPSGEPLNAVHVARKARSMGLSDEEIAKALGISLKRFVEALYEAGLCPQGGNHRGTEEGSLRSLATSPMTTSNTTRWGRRRMNGN